MTIISLKRKDLRKKDASQKLQLSKHLPNTLPKIVRVPLTVAVLMEKHSRKVEITADAIIERALILITVAVLTEPLQV